MKIYISGPMTGTGDIEKRFEEAEKELRTRFTDAEIVNPMHMAVYGGLLTHEEFMEIDLIMLRSCQMIYMLSGWKKSLGANRELGYAQGKEKIVLYQEDMRGERDE